MTPTNTRSIRQICLNGFLNGQTTTEIAATITANFPESMAAQKATKHIGWHRADMKKRGLLPAKTAEAEA